MAQVSEYGYGKLRDFITANWKYIELQDEAGTPVMRIGVGDARVTWLESEFPNILQLQIRITGQDVPELPQPIAKTAIYDVPNGGTAIAVEMFDTVRLAQTIDELTVVHNIHVPIIE